jgi:hypothetical protein
MNMRALARSLGGEIVGTGRILAPGPGHSPSDRSMSVLIADTAPDGFVVSSFAGDDWRECRDHVLERLGHKSVYGRSRSSPAVRQIDPDGRREHDDCDQHQRLAANLWDQARPIGGTVAETYLTGRGLAALPEALDGYALRFVERCPFRLATGDTVYPPAMVAAMVDVRTSALVGIHRTALAADGSGKAAIAGLGNPKKMLGRAGGACIKLSADEDVTQGLHIAEGIETALACIEMGFRPMWVALSAGGIANFPVLPGIEALTIFADNDTNDAGLLAARRRALRWTAEFREVIIRRPAIAGHDWADTVLA